MEYYIDKLDHFGNGISKVNDKIVFIKHGLVGEKVSISLIKSKKNYSLAKISKIVDVSKLRIESICPYYELCGGCNFLHTTYDNEIDFKNKKGNDILGKIEKVYQTEGMNYRNKVTLHVDNNKIGFYKEKTREIIDISYCYLLNDCLNEVLVKINKYIKKNKHDIISIILKTNGNNVLMDILGKIDNNFVDYFFDVDTIINNGKVIKGIGYIEEMIDDYRFKISSESFFQVNKQGLESIIKIIRDYLKSDNYSNALDLYSGTSTWGIVISPYVKEVISIEVNKDATKDALSNIDNNHINNLKVICGKVENHIDKFRDIDLIIIDPPRCGLDKKTIDYLKKIKAKKIIYISCDMFTLKRDINDLSELYKVDRINLVDMFKRTYHVESVALLVKKVF